VLAVAYRAAHDVAITETALPNLPEASPFTIEQALGDSLAVDISGPVLSSR
jgi:hypothetical protein